MGNVIRVWGGSYHDYWFTDDAILKVRLISRVATLVGIVVLVVLTALFATAGAILGALVAVIIYFVGGRMAKSKRPKIAELSPKQVRDKGLVTLRVPYSVISKAELRGARLTIFVEGRKIRIKTEQESLQNLQLLLRSKLADSFTVTP